MAFENVDDSAIGASDLVDERVTRLLGCDAGTESVSLRFLGGMLMAGFQYL